jgi:hypothetical protein
MKIVNQSPLLLSAILMTCMLSIMDWASCHIILSPVLTPESIGHMVFPHIILSGGMSFFAAGIAAGRLAALRTSTSDIKLNRPAIDYSFKKNRPHVKEQPFVLDQISSTSPLKFGLGLH